MQRTLSISIITTTLLLSTFRANADEWVSAYFVSPLAWEHYYSMPASEIDFQSVTHVMHYCARPVADGTLNLNDYFQAATAPNLIARAHAAARKVIFVIGHSNSAPRFRGATSSANLNKFVANIISVVKQYGYDGVDIDWEDLDPTDAAQFTAFIRALRSELNNIYPRPELTAAVSRGAGIIAGVQDAFDQINVGGYDLTWPDLGISWHNSAVEAGGYTEPLWNGPVPTIQWHIMDLIKAGVPPSKLGLGIPFAGYVWTGGTGTVTGGVTMPGQLYTTPPKMAGIDYNELVNTIYRAANARRDIAAQVPYLSFDEPGSATDRFVSYDDELSVADKVQYGKNAGLGGFMIWELSAGYFADRAVGQRQPLLAAITKARGSVANTPPNVIRVNAGGLYHTDAQGNVWASDGNYSGGATYTVSSPIAATTTPTLYQSERYSKTPLTYTFTVPNGTYAVTLKFAELYFTSAAQRVFNVALNGNLVQENFDIFAAAGAANRAVDSTYVVAVTNGQIAIQLNPVIQYPKISAIEIKPAQ